MLRNTSFKNIMILFIVVILSQFVKGLNICAEEMSIVLSCYVSISCATLISSFHGRLVFLFIAYARAPYISFLDAKLAIFGLGGVCFAENGQLCPNFLIIVKIFLISRDFCFTYSKLCLSLPPKTITSKFYYYENWNT